MNMKIRDISDKGKKQNSRLRYEVRVLHTTNEEESPEILAKFQKYGDAYNYANFIKNGNIFYEEVLIRS